MHTQLLYPSDPFYPKRLNKVDDMWIDEANAAKEDGFEILTINTDEIDLNKSDFTGKNLLYRGWMLTPTDYETMYQYIESKGGHLIFNTAQYARTHYLPNWYSDIEKHTAKTIVITNPEELIPTLKTLNWENGYFLKDYVKSLKTGTGSTVFKPEDSDKVLEQMIHFRGKIEGGICIREYTEFKPDTEIRLFAYNGIVTAPYKCSIPEYITEVANKFKDILIAIDISTTTNGDIQIVEIGNGQVSDSVGWDINKFSEMLKTYFTPTMENTLSM